MKKRLDIVIKMMKIVKGVLFLIIVMIILNLIYSLVSMVNPFVFKVFIDDVLTQEKYNLITFVIVSLLIVYILRFIMDALRLYMSNTLKNKFVYKLRSSMWNSYTKFNCKTFSDYNSGDMKMRLVDDCDMLAGFINEQIVDYILNIMTVILNIFALFIINYKFAFISIIIIPVFLFINYIIGKKFQAINEEKRKLDDEYYSFENNSIQNWREIKIHNAQNSFIKIYNEFRQKIAYLSKKWIRVWFFNEINSDFKANYVCNILLYLIGAWFVINGEISVGELLMFCDYFNNVFINTDQIIQRHISIITYYPFYSRIFEVLDIYKFQEQKTKNTSIDKYDLKADNISFSYNNEIKVLDNLSLDIKEKEKIVLYGESGCGKTTLINLLSGLNIPDSGKIQLSGNDISVLNNKVLNKNIMTILQDSKLFNGSIRDNFKIINKDITDQEIIHYLKCAQIDDIITLKKEGLDFIINENSNNISGGQKQRILIAQALAAKSNILILDEATASIDEYTEKKIMDYIIEKDNMSAITITHRPALQKRFNKKYKLENTVLKEI